MVYGVLGLTISENSWAGLCGFGILLKNPSQTRPIPIEANQLAPVSDLADRQSIPNIRGIPPRRGRHVVFPKGRDRLYQPHSLPRFIIGECLVIEHSF